MGPFQLFVLRSEMQANKYTVQEYMVALNWSPQTLSCPVLQTEFLAGEKSRLKGLRGRWRCDGKDRKKTGFFTTVSTPFLDFATTLYD